MTAEHLFDLFLPIALAWLFLSVFYWYVLQPVLIRSIQFDLFEHRDNLRMMMIVGDAPTNSFSHRYLEKRLCKSVRIVRDSTMFRFLHFVMTHEGEFKVSYETERFEKAAPPELRLLADKASRKLLTGMLINSPLILFGAIAGALVYRLGILAGDWKKKILERFHSFLDEEVFLEGYATGVASR